MLLVLILVFLLTKMVDVVEVLDFPLLLAQHSDRPWCIFGDFNDIIDPLCFCQTMIDSRLCDVPLEGYSFMWFKSLGTPHVVEERLDRTLRNTDSFNAFPSAKLENLVALKFDHYLILLDRSPIVPPNYISVVFALKMIES